MQLADIVLYWSGAQSSDAGGRWCHREDRALFEASRHSFNLDHPVSPYVGDVLCAAVIILGANAGYSSRTASEFPNDDLVQSYVGRVNAPTAADWSGVSPYYAETNYGELIAGGQAVLVNACAYRSRKISEEPENRALVERLPSVRFTRKWLMEAVIPLARAGKRLVVGKRYGLWNLPAEVFDGHYVIKDPAPVSPRITGIPYARLNQFLAAEQASDCAAD